MAYVVGTSYFTRLRAVDSSLESSLRKAKDTSRYWVKGIIKHVNQKPPKYLIAYPEVLETRQLSESQANKMLKAQIPTTGTELILEKFIKVLPSKALRCIREKTALLHEFEAHGACLQKGGLVPHTNLDFSSPSTRSKKLGQTVPAHLLEIQQTAELESIRAELLRLLVLETPLFDAKEELHNFIKQVGSKIFRSMCDGRRRNSHASIRIPIKSALVQTVLIPYLKLSGIDLAAGVRNGEFYGTTTSKAAFIKAFADPKYQDSFFNPIVRPCFTKDAQTFQFHKSSQKIKKNIALNPLKCKKQELIASAKKELHKVPKQAKLYSTARLAQLVVSSRISSPGKTVGITKVFNMLIDVDHAVTLSITASQSGSIWVQMDFEVSKTNHSYEGGGLIRNQGF